MDGRDSKTMASGDRKSLGEGGDRRAPANLDAERAALGAALLDASALNVVVETLHPDDFFREAHKLVFDAICALAEAGTPVDALTVAEELGRRGHLERVGGHAYLAELLEAVPALTAVEHYARTVRDEALRRRMIYAAHDIAKMGYSAELSTREYLDRAEKLVFEVLQANTRGTVRHVRDVLHVAVEQIKRYHERGEDVTGLRTGFEKLDRLTLGLQRSDLIILAARPSMGKTTLALNIATNAALRYGASVLIFSLEMSAEQLVMRLLASEARVELSRIRAGRLDADDWEALADAVGALSQAPLYIEEMPGISPLELRARARRMKLEGHCDLIVVDYLQLMQSHRRPHSREQEISEISRSLKQVAKELDVPVLALSQLNRSLESRSDKRPLMSDLRESGAIEQDADIIAFIYRDEVYNPDTKDRGIAEIIVAKHRNGPTGRIRVKFFDSLTRFDNLYEDDEAFAPV